jgi:hypothetical protein
MKLAADLRVLLLGAWLGAALFFSFAVAPSAFAVLPSRELAGSLVNRTLGIVNYSGLAIGLVALAGSFVFRRGTGGARLLFEQALLVLLSTACAVGQFVIGARLHGIRREIGRPIEELAADDPLRAAFNDLHVYSVWVLTAAMLAALVAFFLAAQRNRAAGNDYR